MLKTSIRHRERALSTHVAQPVQVRPVAPERIEDHALALQRAVGNGATAQILNGQAPGDAGFAGCCSSKPRSEARLRRKKCVRPARRTLQRINQQGTRFSFPGNVLGIEATDFASPGAATIERAAQALARLLHTRFYLATHHALASATMQMSEAAARHACTRPCDRAS
jgi:hypothetical protein